MFLTKKKGQEILSPTLPKTTSKTADQVEVLKQMVSVIQKKQDDLMMHLDNSNHHTVWFDGAYDVMWANYRMLTALMMDTYKKQMVELGLFDEDFYKKNYPEYKKYGLSAIDHYIDIGWQMHYNPSPTFNTKRYLRGHHLLQICPLLHFLQMGRYYASYAYYNEPQQEPRRELPPAKRCVYTCLVGNYDSIQEPTHIEKGWDYICFTDNSTWLREGKIGSWTFRPVLRDDLDPTRLNRYHKLLPYTVLPDYDESLYIDSNVDIVSPFIFDLIKARGGVGLLLPYHFMDKCAYRHTEWIVGAGKDESAPIKEFGDIMKKSGFPHDFGMTENNVIFRDHANKRMQRIMEEWWQCIVKYCKRDQLSLSYLLWKDKIALFDICFANARSAINHFKLTCHK